MPALRILVLTSMYPPHHYGGYEQLCRDVVTRFRERGHAVEVLTSTLRVDGVGEPAGERGAGIRRDLAFYWEDHVLQKPSVRKRLAIERANQAALRRALDEFRPDVVSVWAMGAMSFGLLTTLAERNVPTVAYVCDEWPVYGPHIDPWADLFSGWRQPLARVVRPLLGVPTAVGDLGPAAAWCFISDSMRRVAARESGWSYPVATTVWCGIDGRDFPVPSEPATERPWRGRLLYAGRIDERKGIDTAVQALPLLPDATLEINGRGDNVELQRLEDLSMRLGVRDRVLIEASPRHELRSRYAAADVVAVPSRWREPFGLVPVEAMACDTPVVATGTGGTGEFLADGVNALLHRPRDHEGLAAAVQRLADDPALRRRLVVSGRETARELTVDRLTDVLEQWHIAAADRFAHGVPPDRPAPRPG
jgi:glycogen synthase